jgi:glycosyltransferase involved in cell wall biosynthesis
MGGVRPRVAVVCGNLLPARDGVADYTVSLLAAMGERADVWVVTAGQSSSGTAVGEPPGARVRRVSGGWGPRGVAALAGALRRDAPDVVHVQYAPAAFGYSPAVGLLPLGLTRRTTLVTTLHEYGWWSWPARLPPGLWRPVEDRGWWDRESGALVPRSDRLVVTNQDHAAVVRRRLGRAARCIPVGANVLPAGEPASLARERRGVRARLGLPPDAPVLVFFGFVHPVKGLRYLIEALALLTPGRPELRLVIAGGFASLALPDAQAQAFRRELADRARAAGVADRVVMTGHLPAPAVSAVLRAADVAVLPFTAGVTAKSGALVALAAHGLPVVATAADPPDPALVDGVTAVVVPRRRDSRALAAGIERTLGHDRLRARVRAGVRELAADRGWAAIAQAHLDLYAELRGRPPRRRSAVVGGHLGAR